MKNVILIVILQTILVAGIGAGGWFLGKNSCQCSGEAMAGGEAGAGGAAPAIAKQDPIFKELETLVLNMRDGERLRFMQVQVTVKTFDSAVVDAIDKFDPRIRGEMISLFGEFTVPDVSTPEGKVMLQQKSLEKLNAILAEEAGIKGGVDSLYFTKLVIQ